MPHVASTKIKSIACDSIRDGSDDKRTIPEGLFKPHMTWMISGKTGSGKSTALIRMLTAYCDSGVFQKVVLISPTAAYDAKYKMLPLSAEENCSHLTPEEFQGMFQHATKEPHDFMMCDFKRNEVRRNFDEVLHLCPQTSSQPKTEPKDISAKA